MVKVERASKYLLAPFSNQGIIDNEVERVDTEFLYDEICESNGQGFRFPAVLAYKPVWYTRLLSFCVEKAAALW